MVKAQNPEINVDELMAKIRGEVAQRRNNETAAKAKSDPLSEKIDWLKLDNQLEMTKRYSLTGTVLPTFENYPGPLRLFARWMGKIVIYLSSFITYDQRQFNTSILQLLQILIAGLAQQQQETNRRLDQLKTDLILQESRITMLLEEARRRLPEPFNNEQLQVIADAQKNTLDVLYLNFEDQFRVGTREDIKERLRTYLPIIVRSGLGTDKTPILDLGCGRGEWLELLKEEGLHARGLDINRVMLEQCKNRGFEVAEGDALSYMRGLPDDSVGVVTAFHLIEHLPFETLINLLDETLRVLKPGGLLIFETPNPQNIIVGSHNFYLDPTHRKPLPSALIKFLIEFRGFCRIEIINLHPFPEEYKIYGSTLAERFNEYFYGPQDYAAIGYKVLSEV